MTPQEKAFELFQKFGKYALIFIDELFSHNVGYDRNGVYGKDIIIDEEYWEKVKQEIEKL